MTNSLAGNGWACITAVALGLVSSTQVRAESFLFWSANNSGIWRAGLTDAGLTDPHLIVPAETPYRLDVDPVGRKVYWAGGPSAPHIYEANLDGTEAETFFSDPQMKFPYGLDVDRARIYWTDHDTATVWSASIDHLSSGRQRMPELHDLHDIEVGDSRWYFQGQTPGTIQTSLAHNIPRSMPVPRSTVTGPHGIALDSHRDILAWTNHAPQETPAIYLSSTPAPVSGYIPGDGNGDSTIDLTDFSNFKEHFASGLPNWRNGDFNNDLQVDLSDFGLLKKNLGGPVAIRDPQMENPGPIALDLGGLAGPADSIYWGQPNGIFRATLQRDAMGHIAGYDIMKIYSGENIQGLAMVTFNDDAGLVGQAPEPGTFLLASLAACGLLALCTRRRAVAVLRRSTA